MFFANSSNETGSNVDDNIDPGRLELMRQQFLQVRIYVEGSGPDQPDSTDLERGNQSTVNSITSGVDPEGSWLLYNL